MYHCFAIGELGGLIYDCLNHCGQTQVYYRQVNRHQYDHYDDECGRCVSFLPRRPVDLSQLLPGLLNELDRMAKRVLKFLNPVCHEANDALMAGQAGFEPATAGFGVRSSSQLELLTPRLNR